MADDPGRPPAGKGKGSQAKKGLMKRIGPLPLWAWGGLAIAAGVIYYSIHKNQQQPKKPQTPTTQPTASAYSTSPSVGTLASQVPQFVNQTYTNPTPQSITQTNTNTNRPPAPPPPPHKTPAPHQKPPKGGKDPDDATGGNDDTGPGGKGRTGGWKGQHSNGQGSHHGGPGPARKPRVPVGINPGGPIRGKRPGA